MSASTIDPRTSGVVRRASSGSGKPRSARDENRNDSRDRDDSQSGERFIGVDFSKFAMAPKSRTWLPLLVLALSVALGISALRIDLIRTRYALMDTMKQEQALIEKQHALIVDKLTLRDPSILAALAERRGYRPAEVIRTLIDPMPMEVNPAQGLPHVASGPLVTRGTFASEQP